MGDIDSDWTSFMPEHVGTIPLVPLYLSPSLDSRVPRDFVYFNLMSYVFWVYINFENTYIDLLLNFLFPCFNTLYSILLNPNAPNTKYILYFTHNDVNHIIIFNNSQLEIG